MTTSSQHRHRPQGEPKITGFVGPVNVDHPNPAAHGNIRETSVCSCGAIRERNLNGSFVESSGWYQPCPACKGTATDHTCALRQLQGMFRL